MREFGERADWWPVYRAAEEQLHGLPEYLAALHELHGDKTIACQLGKSLRTPTITMPMPDPLEIILLHTMSDRDLTFDETAFERAYLRTEAEIYSSTIPQVAVAPVAGLADSPRLEFDGVELDRLTEDEADALLEAGLLSWHMSSQMAGTSTEYALRLRYDAPRIIGGQSPATAAPLPYTDDIFLSILSAMRLLKGSVVGLPGVLVMTDQPMVASRSWHRLAPTLPFIGTPSYSLAESEGSALVSLWQVLRHSAVTKRDFLGTAIRRIGYASERPRPEDQFVDLMVAAEAMFLGEQRKGETTSELTLKISTRFAYFTDLPGTTRRARYDHMKKAYGARSRILHGDRPKGMSEKDFEEFTATTALYLRIALRAMLAEAVKAPDKVPLVCWDDLIIGR